MKIEIWHILFILLIFLTVVGVFVWRRRYPFNEISTGLALPTVETENHLKQLSMPIEFQLAVDDGQLPVLRAKLMDFSALPDNARVLDVSDVGISRLGPLIQLAPSALVASNLASHGNLMEVVVSGKLAESVDGQWLRPFVLGSDGRISEMARLKEAGNFAGLVNGALMFHAVSALVAQKHLADINSKLSLLQKGIDEIKSFLEDQRYHQLQAIIDALQQQIPVIKAGEHGNSWHVQLNFNDQLLTGNQSHLAGDINNCIRELDQIKTSGYIFGNADKIKVQVEHQLSRLDRLFDEWLLSTHARIAGWAMLSAFPRNDQLSASRLSSIENTIRQLDPTKQLPREIESRLPNIIAMVQGPMGGKLRKQEASAIRSQLTKQKKELLANMIKKSKLTETGISETQEAKKQSGKHIRLAIQLQDGVVVKAYELDSHIHLDELAGEFDGI